MAPYTFGEIVRGEEGTISRTWHDEYRDLAGTIGTAMLFRDVTLAFVQIRVASERYGLDPYTSPRNSLEEAEIDVRDPRNASDVLDLYTRNY
jgi:hypothetical protein